MKKFGLFLVAVFLVTTFVGCNKKNKEEAALDNMTSGVVSENVVSMSDATAGMDNNMSSSIPVMVENAEAIPQSVGDMAMGVALGDKPTPKQIQQALKAAGFYTGKIDGTIGPKTKKAIEEFQSQNGLKADGKVGAKTWKALAAHLTQAVEVNNPSDQVQDINN